MAQASDEIELTRKPIVERRRISVPLRRSARGAQVAAVAFLTLGLTIAGTAMPVATGYLTSTGTNAAMATRVSVSLWSVCLSTTVTLDNQHSSSTPTATLGPQQTADGCVRLEDSTCRSDAFPTAHWTRAFFILETIVLIELIVFGICDVALKFRPRPIDCARWFTLRRHYTGLSFLALLFNIIQVSGILWIWHNTTCLGAGAVLAPGMVITSVAIVGVLSMIVISFFSRPSLDYEAVQQTFEQHRIAVDARAARAQQKSNVYAGNDADSDLGDNVPMAVVTTSGPAVPNRAAV